MLVGLVSAAPYVGIYEQVYRCCVASLGVKSHKGKYDLPSVGLVGGISYERYCPKKYAELCATFFDPKKPQLIPSQTKDQIEWIPNGKALKQSMQLSIEKAHEFHIQLYATEKPKYTQQQMNEIIKDHNIGEQRLYLSNPSRIKWSDIVDPEFIKVISDIGKSRAVYEKEVAHELAGLKKHYDSTLEEISKWDKAKFEPIITKLCPTIKEKEKILDPDSKDPKSTRETMIEEPEDPNCQTLFKYVYSQLDDQLIIQTAKTALAQLFKQEYQRQEALGKNYDNNAAKAALIEMEQQNNQANSMLTGLDSIRQKIKDRIKHAKEMLAARHVESSPALLDISSDTSVDVDVDVDVDVGADVDVDVDVDVDAETNPYPAGDLYLMTHAALGRARAAVIHYRWGAPSADFNDQFNAAGRFAGNVAEQNVAIAAQNNFQAWVLWAMREWEKRTGLLFEEWQAGGVGMPAIADTVEIQLVSSWESSSSYVGYLAGNWMRITYSAAGLNTFTTTHELGHALGLHHTNVRSDAYYLAWAARWTGYIVYQPALCIQELARTTPTSPAQEQACCKQSLGGVVSVVPGCTNAQIQANLQAPGFQQHGYAWNAPVPAVPGWGLAAPSIADVTHCAAQLNGYMWQHNYAKKQLPIGSAKFATKYDYGSVMHYPLDGVCLLDNRWLQGVRQWFANRFNMYYALPWHPANVNKPITKHDAWGVNEIYKTLGAHDPGWVLSNRWWTSATLIEVQIAGHPAQLIHVHSEWTVATMKRALEKKWNFVAGSLAGYGLYAPRVLPVGNEPLGAARCRFPDNHIVKDPLVGCQCQGPDAGGVAPAPVACPPDSWLKAIWELRWKDTGIIKMGIGATPLIPADPLQDRAQVAGKAVTKHAITRGRQLTLEL